METHIEIDVIGEPVGMIEFTGAADMRELQCIDACRDAPREEGCERIRIKSDEGIPEITRILRQHPSPARLASAHPIGDIAFAEFRRMRFQRRGPDIELEAGFRTSEAIEALEHQGMGQGEERGIGIIGEGFPKGECPIGREFSDEAIGEAGRSLGFDVIGIL